jgi:hypothetical protein
MDTSSIFKIVALISWTIFGLFNIFAVFLTKIYEDSIKKMDIPEKVILFFVLFLGGGFVLSFSLRVLFKNEKQSDKNHEIGNDDF